MWFERFGKTEALIDSVSDMEEWVGDDDESMNADDVEGNINIVLLCQKKLTLSQMRMLSHCNH